MRNSILTISYEVAHLKAQISVIWAFKRKIIKLSCTNLDLIYGPVM